MRLSDGTTIDEWVAKTTKVVEPKKREPVDPALQAFVADLLGALNAVPGAEELEATRTHVDSVAGETLKASTEQRDEVAELADVLRREYAAACRENAEAVRVSLANLAMAEAAYTEAAERVSAAEATYNGAQGTFADRSAVDAVRSESVKEALKIAGQLQAARDELQAALGELKASVDSRFQKFQVVAPPASAIQIKNDGTKVAQRKTINFIPGSGVDLTVADNGRGDGQVDVTIAATGGGGTVDVVSNVAQDRILGRVTAGSGDSEELTAAQARTLLNVEDGATADQTAAEILTAVKTVDGSGSGLDADTLRATTPSVFGLTLIDDADAATARGTLGLGNVDNTADASKPVSTAQQTALDAKAPTANPVFTGTVTIPDGALAIADTSGLQTALDGKAALAGATFTGAVREAVVALTDGANIALDASLGNVFTVTLGGNRTLDNPTNPVNGQKVVVRVRQDATGSRTLAYGSAYRFGTDVVSPTLTTTAAKTDYLGFIYNSTDSKWDAVAVSKGY